MVQGAGFQRGWAASAVAAWLLLAGVAGAAEIRPASYDMPNGNGHATGGWFNYWDKFYTGQGAVTVDNAPLTGGLGDLVDGVVPTTIWDRVENDDGTGPYVGWLNMNPVITFHFDAGTVIETVVVHVEDSLGTGGVTPPSAILVNGVETVIDLPEVRGGAPMAIEIGGLAIEGDVAVQLMRRSAWVFASEVTFRGVTPPSQAVATATPEPGTLALLGVGVVALLGARRKAFFF